MNAPRPRPLVSPTDEAALAAEIARCLTALDEASAVELPEPERQALEDAARRRYQTAVWALAMRGERVAHREARRCGGLGDAPQPDLVQVGFEGLFEAATRFDPGRGVPFPAYARWCVRNHIRRAVYASRPIRLPDSINDLALIARKLPAGLSESEAAAELGVEIERVRVLRLWLSRPYVSMDATSEDSENGETMGQRGLGAEPAEDLAEVVNTARLNLWITELLYTLPSRTARIIVRNFGLDGEPPQDLNALGRRWRLSRERVRQIRDAGLLSIAEQLPND